MQKKKFSGDFAEPNAPTRALALSTDDRGHACAREDAHVLCTCETAQSAAPAMTGEEMSGAWRSTDEARVN